MINPKVWVYTIIWNEARMLPWFLHHYSFADKIVIYDERSTDGSREIIQRFKNTELREWMHRGLDDEKFLQAVNCEWKEAAGKADWVMWPDCDELLWHTNMFEALQTANGDVIASEGWALMDGKPTPSPSSTEQIWHAIRTGARQENYDKLICWRPTIAMTHTIGRHTYAGQFPKFSGKLSSNVRFKLLHCHYIGSLEEAAKRNQRNYLRAVDKRFAWNFDSQHDNNPKQGGSSAWVRHVLENQELVNLFEPMNKLHFGCGGRNIAGWKNFDIDVDIRKPLPFPDGSASHIFAEHVIEHVTHQEAWRFLEECYRVLGAGGVVRIALPDIAKLSRKMTDEYRLAVKKGGYGDGSVRAALKAAVFCHGHQAAWTRELLATFLEAVGFKARDAYMGKSHDPQLVGIEQHGKAVGESVAEVETSIVEGLK